MASARAHRTPRRICVDDDIVVAVQRSSATSTVLEPSICGGTGIAEAAIVRVAMMETKRPISEILIISSTNVMERWRGF